MERLSKATLSAANADGVTLPPSGWDTQRTGIVHMGIGAFHRAHQAVYTQDAFAATGDDRWGICGVTQRSDRVRRQLAGQDGLYGVLERAVDHTGVRVVGQVREVLFPAEQNAELMARIADPATRVITLTVTEKGYRRDGQGGLDLTDPAVAADLAGGEPASAIGRLVRGLQARQRAGAEPITVVCCDNLASNGRVLKRLVDDFCAALGDDELTAWIASKVSFPCTMVDRIAPATTDADRAMGEQILGLHDEGLVTAELFKQWVIEDDFVAERPAWEQAGAQLTDDVEPFENMKLRILNGTHSTLAYAGALRGYPTITRTMADPELAELASGLITEDVIPVLECPPGEDLPAYGAEVLKRFSNPALAHKTTQIAMDGSQKIPLRLLSTIRDNLAAGRNPAHAITGVAAWMAYLATPEANGLALPIDDPMADRLAVVRGSKDPRGIVGALMGIEDIFGTDLPGNTAVHDQLVDAVTALLP
ncbi:mannitol dehydrogenase family protein [Propionibacterium australiense]|uniref:Mannitol-1-phosphate 5-dehydrogenase n=1 Tax=Propionibacterium australiense TaxID=119981 RepID=A0A383S8L0_9ACTN|nr:mannitol dehydrogenase family protein [Propionibacterium australiense]RLP06778.1 mannitol dehydrogenase family protein [Propionibacterium australiense]RLP06944.1 mannitol dehydrogenase family protein [Propionibacterium australiense]SYZ34061.1 Mannitol dehydrogenase Rossmann domain [Propionibacterium australiense]VEH92115.1 Mannitol 2-dehydrogenase [Propionibacterium australiense]